MANEQDWQTDTYRGMEVHVSPLPRADGQWDYSVRIAYPGEDSSASSDLEAMSGDDGDYPSKEKAVEAAFAKAYRMVDELQP